MLTFLFGTILLYGQNTLQEIQNYPIEPTYQPLTVRANIVILTKEDGTGNFDMKDKEQRELLTDYVNRVNSIYANLGPAEDPKICKQTSYLVTDTKIRMVYNFITIKNEYGWNYMNAGGDPDNNNLRGFSPSEKWYLTDVDKSIHENPQYQKGINVFLTTNGDKFSKMEQEKGKNFDLNTNAAAQLPSTRNLERSSQVHMPNRYIKYLYHKFQVPVEYNSTWKETREWHLQDAKGLAHEFGHNFGLTHTNQCSNALMKQGVRKDKYFISEMELRTMHWNLSASNLMQFVTPESAYGATWYLNENTEWKAPRRFYHNFEIAKDVTLTISETIILPPQAFVKLNKGSKIIFKGKGKIIDANGKEFTHFRKHKKSQVIYEP